MENCARCVPIPTWNDGLERSAASKTIHDRTGDQDAASGVVAALAPMVRAVRRRCRRARIIVRADSGFCREEIMARCESRPEEVYITAWDWPKTVR